MRRVTLVASDGSGSMEVLARELARRAPVRTLWSARHRDGAEGFNPSLPAAIRFARADLALVRAIRAATAPGELVHLPHHHMARYGPWIGRPYVVTVHDLIRQRDRRLAEPMISRPGRIDRAMLELDAIGIRRADAVIAVSETTRREVVREMEIAPERIHVVHPGIDPCRYRPVARPAELPDADPYLLFVGSEHPRKNLRGLFAALALLRERSPHLRLRLVKAGAPGGPEAPFRAETLAALQEAGLRSGREVLLLGRVSHERLLALYSGAVCLIQPSLQEGFGLPPLEAMACGCPVIVSDRGALPEIAGPAALVTEPSPQPLAQAIERLLTEPALAGQLRSAGAAHVGRYSWEEAAARTIAIYESVTAAARAPGPRGVRSPPAGPSRGRRPALADGDPGIGDFPRAGVVRDHQPALMS